MGLMRQTRESTLKILFQQEFASTPLETNLQIYRKNFLKDVEVKWDYIEKVVPYTYKNRENLDQKIDSLSNNWRVERLALVDLILLRMAICEITLELTPYKVAINETLDLAKVYSSKDSVSFLNGVLDQWGAEWGKD